MHDRPQYRRSSKDGGCAREVENYWSLPVHQTSFRFNLELNSLDFNAHSGPSISLGRIFPVARCATSVALAARKSYPASSFGCTHKICSKTRGIISAQLISAAKKRVSRGSRNAGYVCSTLAISELLRSVTPSSSCSSRFRASSGDSPASTLPPGNSHFNGKVSSFRRWQISRRPSRSITATTTVIIVRHAPRHRGVRDETLDIVRELPRRGAVPVYSGAHLSPHRLWNSGLPAHLSRPIPRRPFADQRFRRLRPTRGRLRPGAPQPLPLR